MPNTTYKPLADGEPRGERHGEPREDDLDLVIIDGEPKYWVKNGEDRVCGAKTSGWQDNYRRCRNHSNIDNGNKRCPNHGGDTPRGLASPSWEGKGRSDYLPEALGDRFDEHMKDPDITSVREDLALTNLRIDMQLEKIEEGGSADKWEELQDEMETLEEARRKGDSAQVSASLNRIDELVTEGNEQQEMWEEIFSIIEKRRKLVETENKRLQQSSNTLTVEEASMLVDVLTSTVLDILDRYDVPQQAYNELQDATERLLETG